MKNSNKHKIIHLIFFQFFKKNFIKKVAKKSATELSRLRYLISVFLLSHDFFFLFVYYFETGSYSTSQKAWNSLCSPGSSSLMVILLPPLQSARISDVNTQTHVPNSCFAWTWLVVGTNHQVFFLPPLLL